MRFWDTSAVIPLIVDEPASDAVRATLREDEALVVWWGTRVECVSALVRRSREGRLASAGAAGEEQARGVLRTLSGSWSEMQPTLKLRALAERSLAVHRLRAAAALQLAAALRWCEDEPENHGFVCLDDRLREAARREGFRLLPA